MQLVLCVSLVINRQMSGSDSAPYPIPHPKHENRFRTRTDSAPDFFSLFSGAESDRVRNWKCLNVLVSHCFARFCD